MDQRIISLYDEYTHTPLARDVFIKKLVRITGSIGIAMSILPSLEGNYAQAATFINDHELETGRVTYPGDGGNNEWVFSTPEKRRKILRYCCNTRKQGPQRPY